MIKVDVSRVIGLNYLTLQNDVNKVNEMIDSKTGKGNDFLGWTTYANEFSENEVDRVIGVCDGIKKNCDVLLVIGIGGSYLGAKAAIDAINGMYPEKGMEIVYLGNTVSPTYTAQVMKHVSGKKIAINVISKSGTTVEPAIALRLAINEAKKVWGNDYYKYVVATTDAARGALFQIATDNNYAKFVIPDDVGGRYSVFTPVGLIPMCCAGLNIKAFLEGTKEGIKEYSNPDLNKNEAYKYAATRYLLQKDKKFDVEYMITYEPHLVGLREWWKQLFGESEGKDGKGILPGGACFSTDLHSIGQFIQEGTGIFFETTIKLENYQEDIEIPATTDDIDGLNYIAGNKMSYVNDIVINSTLDAHHIDGGRQNIVISIDKMDEFNLGKLMFFFCKACAMSAYMLDVNPFNQPGVEYYKARMKKMLKK